MNRKAQVSPMAVIPILIVTLLMFSMGSYIVYTLWIDMKPSLQDNLGSSGDGILNETGNLVDGLGNIWLLILGGIILFVIIAFTMRDEHPVMFVVGLLFLVIMIFVGVILQSSFQELDDSTNMANASSHYAPTMGIMMNSFVIVILVIIVIALLVAYVRFKG